jgi:hypothetical protein
MKLSTFLRTRITKTLAAILLPLALIACGGGGDTPPDANANTGTQAGTDTATKPTNTASQSATTLVGSNGDMGKYGNALWVSDCGTALASGGNLNTVISGITTVVFGTATGSTVQGTITGTDYSGIACLGTPLRITKAGFVASYTSNLAVTSDVPATFQGNADALLLTASVGTETLTFTAGFLPDFSKFYAGKGNKFGATSLPYTKH